MSAAVANSSTIPSSRSPWILSAPLDTAFIVGLPVLIVPALWLLAGAFSPLVVAGFVLVVLSTAHHLPGFLRVYGDPVLFERYRMRFMLMPPLVLGAVFWLTWNNLAAVLFVSLTWAVWHGLMQVYGVARIYAVKEGENSLWTPKLDRALCFSGFAAVLLSGGLVFDRITAAADGSGLFGLSSLLAALRPVAFGAFVLVALAWGAHHLHRVATGRPVSRIKVATLVVSLAYVFFCWALAGKELILGLAAFEAFHDIQYMAVAWAYNQRLAASGSGNRWLGFLFRPRPALVGLYLLAILAYGAIAFATMRLSGGAPLGANVPLVFVAAFVATSGLLHFYFDGFIWKVRQAKTRRDLGLETGANTGPGFPGYSLFKEGAQVALVLLPLLGLGLLAYHREALELPLRGALARSFPGDARLQLELGAAYEQRGRWDAAVDAYRAALAADSSLALAHHGIGSLYALQGHTEQAVAELRAALANDPRRLDSAVRLGELLLREGRGVEAEAVLRDALARAPQDPGVSEALARALLMDSSDAASVSEAAQLALSAVRATGFQRAPVVVTLARATAARGDYALAITLLKQARDATDAGAELHRQIVRLLVEYQQALESADGGGRSGPGASRVPSTE